MTLFNTFVINEMLLLLCDLQLVLPGFFCEALTDGQFTFLGSIGSSDHIHPLIDQQVGIPVTQTLFWV